MAKQRTRLKELNGVSISKIEIEQDGDLHVEFDLPTPEQQQSVHHRTDITAKRTFDVYEDPELMAAARELFRLLRARVEKVDPYRVDIDCMRCKESRCCREYEVFVDEDDAARIAKHFSVSKPAAVKQYLERRPDWTGDFAYRLKRTRDQDGDLCVFLKRDERDGRMRCSIYDARPGLCRSFDEHDCTLFDGDSAKP